jgi:hypothetical protein
MSNTARKSGVLLGTLALTIGIGTIAAGSASSAVIGNIPADCRVHEYFEYGFATTYCTAHAHRAAAQCTDGNWYFGLWANNNELSGAFCPSGQSEVNASIDLPD